VYADAPAAFDAWVSDQARPAAPGTGASARGRRVFLTNTCAGCHTIRGTTATGTLGPDLTHLASRTSIASGALPNTPGVLSAWIVDPQEAKPGVSMPPTELSTRDLADLLVYLRSLQ
jgi:cytochrome c oxidase subunit 2